jgi:hypothetical protein
MLNHWFRKYRTGQILYMAVTATKVKLLPIAKILTLILP